MCNKSNFIKFKKAEVNNLVFAAKMQPRLDIPIMHLYTKYYSISWKLSKDIEQKLDNGKTTS